MIYRIAHITDLCAVPPEHLTEAIEDLKGAVLSINLARAGLAAVGAEIPPMHELCPYIEFTPDGKGEVTPMMNGKPLFTMKIQRDEASPPASSDAAGTPAPQAGHPSIPSGSVGGTPSAGTGLRDAEGAR